MCQYRGRHPSTRIDVQLRPERRTRRRTGPRVATNKVQKRFVLWFNGNGIPERYWIPSSKVSDYDITPCLAPIGRLRDDILVLSGLDNTYGGTAIPNRLCALMTCTPLDFHRT